MTALVPISSGAAQLRSACGTTESWRATVILSARDKREVLLLVGRWLRSTTIIGTGDATSTTSAHDTSAAARMTDDIRRFDGGTATSWPHEGGGSISPSIVSSNVAMRTGRVSATSVMVFVGLNRSSRGRGQSRGQR